MSSASDLREITTLVGDALSQFAKLFQNEVDLAKAEVGEKAQQIGVALGFLAGAAILVIPAVVMALFALAAALIQGGWSQPVAYFVAAMAASVVAAVLASVGMQRLKPENLKPAETILQLERDKQAVKEFVR